MEEELRNQRWGETLLFAETRRSVLDQIPSRLISHLNLTMEEMMNYILRGELPVMRMFSFKDETDRLSRETFFNGMSLDEKMVYLESNYPDFQNWFESFLSGETVWKNALRREFENPQFIDIQKGLVGYLMEKDYVSKIPMIAQEIMDHFKVRKYKMRASMKGSLENLFDSLNVTDKCRQIVMVKPLEDKVMYKLSNRFGDKMTKIHSQKSLVDVPSRRNKLNNYIGMTFTKNKTSNKVVTVFVEERLPKTTLEQSTLEIIFENLEDADGEVVLRYFLQSVSDITARGKLLKSTLTNLRFDVFDVEMVTKSYQKKYIRQCLLELSSVPSLRHILFSESGYKIDDQRFCLRSLTGKVRSRVEFLENSIVFSGSRDIFDILDLISLVVGYSYMVPSLNVFEPLEKWMERDEVVEEAKYSLDVIEIKDGERVLRKARFFESVYSKVCNKPENVPVFGESLDPTVQDLVYDYFPPEKLIKQLEATGQYEFPRYRSQRIPIQLFYGTATKGKKADNKVRVLGRRRIPRSRKDELSSSENLAHIFGYFPCVVTMKQSVFESKGEEIFEIDDEEEDEGSQEANYIYDENKDEIPLGRRARTQFNFFDLLKSKVTNEILRIGVEEGPASFFQAALRATRRANDPQYSLENFVRSISANPKILQSGIAQFPDSKMEEIQTRLINSLSSFMDSKYFVNMVGEFLDTNIIVMEYSSEGASLEYAFYECANGTVPPNVFEQLNESRRTAILLRRHYQSIPDQYDILIEQDPIQRTEEATFPTLLVKKFLERKITFIDLSPEIMDEGRTVRIKNLSQEHFKLIRGTKLNERYQVFDSTGSRIGTVFSTGETIYPVIHAYPLSPSVGLPTITFKQLLDIPRPPIEKIMSDLEIIRFSGVGYTRTTVESFVTSLMFNDLILLCQPTLRGNDLKMLLSGVAEIETPDPYISRQFSSEDDYQTILLKRKFSDVICLFLLQVMFIESLERYVVKNSYETRSYREWRRELLIRDNTRVPDPESISISSMLGLVGEIKGLMGEIPTSPIISLSQLPILRIYFTESGSIRCFSDEMLERLDSQMLLYEKIIPTLGIQVSVPKLVYRIQGIYESMATLSQSPESVTGVGTRMVNDYMHWQEECRTSIENTNIYENIYKAFFTVNREEPVIGFFGRESSGLWAIQANKTPSQNRYPLFNNTLPSILFSKEREFDVFLPENPDDVIRMKRIL
jgi:hypothetical protein